MRKMPADVIINDDLVIPATELEFTAIRSRGAGGQNVNKVASAIHLRWDAAHSSALPESLRQRLLALDDRRVTTEGIVVIKAQEHRTQERNRRAATERLRQLLLLALVEPTPRKKSRPSATVKRKRLEQKRHRSRVKQLRGPAADD